MSTDPIASPIPCSPPGRLLESVLNRALALDAHKRGQLAALQGGALASELRSMNRHCRIGRADRLRVGPHWQAPADLNLRANTGSLLAFALRRGDSILPPGR